MAEIRVFSASPSDLAAELSKVKAVAKMLEPLASNFDITLKVDTWRDVVPVLSG
jgi:hypothetical protein